MTHKKLNNRLNLHLYQTEKFKTNVLTILIKTALSKETATKNALIARILGKGSAHASSERQAAMLLEALYGAEFDTGVIKKGDAQIIQLFLESIDDAKIFGRAFEFAAGCLLAPVTEDGLFTEENVSRAKEELKKAQASLKNDKKSYARDRMLALMFENEPFGVPVLGFAREIEKETRESLYSHYCELIRNAETELCAVGNLSLERFGALAGKYLTPLCEAEAADPDREYPNEQETTRKNHGAIKDITESENGSQARLVLGFNCGFTPLSEEFYAFLMLNEILGGGANSRLFRNIREKRGLCYYISSVIYRQKAVMVIQAGINGRDKERVTALALEELSLLANGPAAKEELARAKSAVLSQLEKIADSPADITDFYMSNLLARDMSEIDETKNAVSRVSEKMVAVCAGKTALSTVYMLT